MELRRACLVLCLFCFAQVTCQQKKQRQANKDVVTMKMYDDLKKALQDLQQDVTHLKEQQALQTICLKGGKALNKCFLHFPEAKTYHEASDTCISQGGTLSAPENGDENDALYEYVHKTLGSSSEVWIGINDMANEGTWVDMTGNRISFKHWETEITTQPDGGKQENCASLSAVAVGKWFDKKCRDTLPFVCQFMIV
ncbi:tetranectin isoform X2 [Bufo gargarizans]|uniref:tetranectin isoform X2 n=1 Tax=Bufo gargarizans TaxID=30331 RepID=UPI001CF35131|nr:tetranectin isoform X2 [Bufo gargarizans]